MTLSLTTSLASTITKSELQDNFSAIQTKFSAGIDNSDISTSAGIAISKLDASKEYVAINLQNPEYTWASAGDPIAMAGLPGLSGNQAAWTLKKAKWFVKDTGSSAGTLDVVLCKVDGSGDLQDVTVLCNEISMTVIADGKFNAGEATIAASSVSYHSSDHHLLLLRQGATTGTGVLNAAGIIGVTLLLERDIQA